MILLGFTGLTIVGVLVWVGMLRRRVEQQTEIIRATLESTADGILVLDATGKIVTYNAKFAELWRIPKSDLVLGDDRKLLEFVLPQLKDPDGFLGRVRSLDERLRGSSVTIWWSLRTAEFSNGIPSPSEPGGETLAGSGDSAILPSGGGRRRHCRRAKNVIASCSNATWRASTASISRGKSWIATKPARAFSVSPARVNWWGRTPRTSIVNPGCPIGIYLQPQETGLAVEF